MIEYHPNNGISAGTQFCMMYATWNPQMTPEIASYALLIVKNGLIIDFESNICLTGKITCQ